MTRYARAKGSKASNERLPNEATPWHVIKQQLEENKNKVPLEKKKSAKELLKDQENAFNSSTGNTEEWAEFEDNTSKSSIRKHKKLNSKKNLAKNSENDIASESNVEKSQETGDAKIETTDRKATKFSNKKKQGINNSNSVPGEKEFNAPQDASYTVLSKRQKRNQIRKRKLEMSNDGSKRFKKDISGKSSNTQTREEKMKKKREYKRRKPNSGVTKMIINGVEIEIVMYDGFPVKKEDAERLAELKQKMILKGKYVHNCIKYYTIEFSFLIL